ncbi:SDR family NAD(P)-dependent oxidoreductase [Bradyrhizobium sp. HKCCYLS2038]|uniref:SDR family NAD(P)-dependent oxidoreductase n=1 Tax=unclassified Bradyrhizobium TaxID=2631580 RepID=UPI003EB77CB2
MVFGLKDRVALITGAAKGIGRRTAQRLHEAGAQVVLCDIDEAGLAECVGLLGNGARAIRLDVTSVDDWRHAIASVEQNEGRLDVLVNNAGVILSRPFLETSLDDLRRVYTTNVEGVFIGMQAAVPLMQQSARITPHGGSIVNLSSIYGQVAGRSHSAYSASKGAVRLLTKAVAVELARLSSGKIRVNSVHPGPTETDLGTSGLHEAVTQGVYANVEVALQQSKAAFPMGRWGQVDDVAGVILFLASDASKFMTGAELTVDGGLTVL